MKTYKGNYNPKKSEKYKGTFPIIFRSSWELSTMIWLDSNPNVIKWKSESTIVPYYNPMDNKYHRYYIDFDITFNDGKTYLIEIKPKNKTQLPNVPKSGKITRRYLNEKVEYIQNYLKWEAAKKYADEKNYIFQVWDQDTLRKLGIQLLTDK